MNRKKLQLFADLVERQLSGETSVIDQIYELNPSLEDGYCLYNIYEQWKGAYSFTPGSVRTLPVISSLAQKIKSYETDDTLQMYSEPEWKIIVDHRGPFECAIRNTCQGCKKKYISFGQSGFDDRYPSICNSCGDVWMQSGYDKEPLPKCECGGQYCLPACTNCDCDRIEDKEYFSSYEYFVDHKWKDKSQQVGI